MKYDIFELRQGEIWVNNQPFLEIIRQIELPYAQAEFTKRVAGEEKPDELSLLAVTTFTLRIFIYQIATC